MQKHDPITAQMEHFVHVCRREEMPVCSGHDAMESLAVILAVLRSAETQMPVRPGDLLKESVAQEGREDAGSQTQTGLGMKAKRNSCRAEAPSFSVVGTRCAAECKRDFIHACSKVWPLSCENVRDPTKSDHCGWGAQEYHREICLGTPCRQDQFSPKVMQ